MLAPRMNPVDREKMKLLYACNNSGSSFADQLLNNANMRLDFRRESLDSRITATRASTKTYFDSTGTMRTAAINEFPREYDPSTLVCRGRSFWESRTNIRTYSQEFDNAAWTKTRSSVTANAVVAPDGTTTADKLVEDSTAAATHTVTVSNTLAANTTATFSVFVKAGERTFVVLRLTPDGINYVACGFNLSNGTAGTAVSAGDGSSPVGRIEAINNGWYRVSVSGISSASVANPASAIYPAIGTTLDSNGWIYNGDGSSGIYIWGAQLEAGATPTPYIPTTSVSVTRAADVVSMTGTNFSSWYNQTEGTFLVVSPQTSSSNAFVQQYLDVSDASVNERMFFRRGPTGIPAFAGVDGGVTQFDISDLTVVSGSASFAACFGYKVNDIAMSVDGRPVSTDTAATIQTTTQLHIGQNFGSSQFANAFISRIVYWTSRLPNTDLQILSRST